MHSIVGLSLSSRLHMTTRPSSTRAARRSAAFIALAFVAACSGDTGLLTAPGPTAARLAPPPPPHYPIIFVHGYNASASTWNPLVARFKADGYTNHELVNWSYDYR